MKKHLLFSLSKKDFELEFYRAGGNGGQNVNKVSTACRIRHPLSGAVASCQEHRHQLQNKKVAFERLVKTDEFKKWHRIMCAKVLGTYVDPDKWADEQMDIKNLKVEIRVDGKWTQVSIDDIQDLSYEDLED